MHRPRSSVLLGSIITKVKEGSYVSTVQVEAPPTAIIVFAHAKYWLWKAITIAVLGPIYCLVIAEGLRMLVPALGQKLHKLPLPGCSIFAQYQETRRLDLALFLSIFLLVAVWWLWEQVLKVFLSTETAILTSGWNPDAYKRLVMILGAVVLVADAALFYIAMVQMGWGTTRFSLAALLATAAYVAVIVFVSLVSLNLRKSCEGR